MGEDKYKRRDANNNKSGCKVRNASATANVDVLPSYTRHPNLGLSLSARRPQSGNALGDVQEAPQLHFML